MYIGDRASALAESNQWRLLLKTDFAFSFMLFWIEAVFHGEVRG